MKRKRLKKSHKTATRTERRERNKHIIMAVMVVSMCLVLGYSAITDYIEGDVSGENYLGQPVGPGIQLIMVGVGAFVGVVWAWQYFTKKPEDRKGERTKKRSGRNARYYRMRRPW